MELTIQKESLVEILSVTQSFVAKKTTLPILVNFLISAADGKLKIAATDLEMTALASAVATVRSSGSTTVNARVFGDIVRELPDGEITIKSSENERIEITTKKSKLRMNGISADEFPALPGVTFEPEGRIAAKQLCEMIGKTLYAVSTDETRFNLNGVCFEVDGKGKKSKTLKLVATDGHRLGMVSRPVSALELEDRMIVPRRGLSELKRILDSESGDVGIEVREGFLIVSASKAKISMHLIDGQFPDYTQVLPQKKQSTAVISTVELAHALRRVALLVSDKSKQVRCDFGKDALRISGSSPELGDASEELPITYTGEPVSIGFNALYLLEFMGSLGEDGNIVVELDGAFGPARLMPEGDESCIGIIMPMRL